MVVFGYFLGTKAQKTIIFRDDLLVTFHTLYLSQWWIQQLYCEVHRKYAPPLVAIFFDLNSQQKILIEKFWTCVPLIQFTSFSCSFRKNWPTNKTNDFNNVFKKYPCQFKMALKDGNADNTLIWTRLLREWTTTTMPCVPCTVWKR